MNQTKINQKLLDEMSCDYSFISLPENVGMDVESHAAAVGIPVHQAIPGIILSVDGKLTAVYKRFSDRINIKILKKKLGAHDIRIATTAELATLGFEPGLVPLVQTQIPSFIDTKAMRLEYLYGGVGSNAATLKIKSSDFLKVTQATELELTFTKENKRVLSGIRATGRLHLGNYLGAVKGMLALQEDPEIETLYMVADIHTITTPYKVDELRDNRRQVILDYLAAGLDPEKSIIFLQSMVPEHTELSFYFSAVMSIARMQHLPTFKDKVKQYPDHATMALLNYPILMSADILVYKAGLVPVGIDQEPHLEIAREIARKMNEQYGLDFPEPTRFATKAEHVPSLKGVGKMSKSVEGSFINLTDSLSDLEKRLSGAATDSGKGRIEAAELTTSADGSETSSLPATAAAKAKLQKRFIDQSGIESSGVANLLTFVELFEGAEKRTYYEELYTSSGIRYGDLKKDLAQAIYKELQPIQEKRAQLEADTDYVDSVIQTGAARARAIAGETMQQVRKAMGLG